MTRFGCDYFDDRLAFRGLATTGGRAENWLFQHGGRAVRESEPGKAILAEVSETSAPSDPRWRRRVLVRGAAVLADACRALFER